MNNVDILIAIDQIGKLAESNIKENNKIQIIKEILSEKVYDIKVVPENTVCVNKSYNANLFFHAWLFPEGLTQGSKDIPTLIGLFHPYGGINCINGADLKINQVTQINQHIHPDGGDSQIVRFSGNVAHFFIDFTIPGIAIGVCYDPRNKTCRIELLISLIEYNKKISLINDSIINQIELRDLFNMLLEMKELNNYLNNPSFNNIKISTKKISRPIFNFNTASNQTMTVFFYGKDTPTYAEDIHVNIDNVERNEIPYIDEIESKLPKETIKYEFSIVIIHNNM